MLVTVALTAHPLPSLLVFQAWKFCDLTNILSIEFFSAHISFYCLVVKSLPPCPQLTGPEADTGLMTDHSDYLSPDLGSVGYSDSPVLSRLMDSRHWSHLWGIKETQREKLHMIPEKLVLDALQFLGLVPHHASNSISTLWVPQVATASL